MRRIAYFGGTFDPVHNGHLLIARALVSLFELERFYFMPAFHAPHKTAHPPTSGYHRFAMLCLATEFDERIAVSAHELDKREKRFTVDTLPELHEKHPDCRVFFVMGADSWSEILTWREWERVLLSSDHIVVTRPGYDISFDHVTDAIRDRVVDVRSKTRIDLDRSSERRIYVSDAVEFDTSATELRNDLRDGHLERNRDVPETVAKYIEKYELYK